MTEEFTFVATGDSFITRRLPTSQSTEFKELAELIGTGDFRFTNFEVTTPGKNPMPSPVSGGTWASGKPEVVGDLKEYGFNCVAWANNHTLDYLYNGLEETQKQLEKAGFVHAGVGGHLADASAPKYMETAAGRVALIAVTSTFHETWIAGEQRRDVPGRPGVNGLRYRSKYQTTEENLKLLKEIAEQVGINARRNLDILEGFLPEDPSGEVVFGEYKFSEGPESRLERAPEPKDMERVIRSIHEAKRQADYVVVSVHSHEMQGEDKQAAADFIEAASRTFIDEGAHAVLGHGPHIVRGIEIYRKRPIFYSLGNFIFQNDTVDFLPADFYAKHGLPADSNVADGIDARSKNNTIGLGTNPLVWESVIPRWKMKDGELTELHLYPIDLGFGQKRYQRGWPELTNNDKVLKDLQALSKPYGTAIDIQKHIGVVKV
ncbi:CapA family protein [Planococcus salinus]|uniref:CapA family protein n=1 Tax=Planococcus salinus TaxID=1848460 RepID=A0A3M8P9U0_9BACL|nr:CapA family protein [Planococcus salinus]RNF39954.1 CapA family protein [Planococcus salinus]